MFPAMKRIKTVVLGSVAIVGALAALVVGAWIYVASTVEEPPYSLVAEDGPIEIRDYPALVLAEVTRRGDRDTAVRAGFGPLARYIFAKDRSGESIAMTAPVTQTRETSAEPAPETGRTGRSEPGEAWRVRFFMPTGYELEALPRPADEDVTLLSVSAGRRAAIRFSGVATDALLAEKEAVLRAWLAARDLSTEGPATYAYYNDPFTPGPLRRNEVILDIAGS